MTLVKLCGITRTEDVETVNKLRPAFAGFVFAEDSHRFIEPDVAKTLISGLDESVTPVGVFLDADPEYVAQCCIKSGVRMVQVHGCIYEDYVRKIKSITGLPVIRAFRISCAEDVKVASRSSADMILLDNGYGGTGTSFDWSLLRNAKRNFILAGGLTPDNIKNAITSAHPYAVDVSTGIETDGLKDPVKMTAFMDAVREADSDIKEETA